MHPSVFPWWPLLLAATAAGPAGGQPGPAPASPPAYRSTLEGYQAFGEQPLAPWRTSNDTVGRIGGWRAYAQEASGQGSLPHPVPAVPAQAGTPPEVVSPAGAGAAPPKAQALDPRLRGNDGN